MENFYQEVDGEWITDPTQVLYAANELYPGKPNTHGLKGFFFQTLNWHWHEPSQTLQPGIHPPFWASSGEPARSTASIQQDVARVVYCVMTDRAPSQRHDKIGMMTARHRDGPCRYRDRGGKWDNFTVTRRQPRWISNGHVS